jgi:galactokinase
LDRGLDILYYGNLPGGAGLSSSASIEVLTGFAFLKITGQELSPVDLALLAQQAENNWVGVKCGIMDQFVVSLGKKGQAILLNCDLLEYRYFPLSLPGACLIITNSNKPHSLAASKYNERRSECEQALAVLGPSLKVSSLGQIGQGEFFQNADLIKDELIRRRAKHIVTENHRTVLAASLLEEGDLEGFGQLMNASHESMRHDFEISCPEMDLLVELAWKVQGLYGSRMTGGGFGGCTVSLIRNEAVENFKIAVSRGYMAQFGYSPSFYCPETSDGAIEIAVRNTYQKASRMFC